jgi:hypothetical protein
VVERTWPEIDRRTDMSPADRRRTVGIAVLCAVLLGTLPSTGAAIALSQDAERARQHSCQIVFDIMFELSARANRNNPRPPRLTAQQTAALRRHAIRRCQQTTP